MSAFKLTGSIIDPKDITSAQFSGRFGVALRLIKGSNTFKEYSEENLKDPEVLGLVKKTRIILDEKFGNLPNSKNPARVIIKLRNGVIREQTVYAAKGSILNSMTKEEVCQKFREFASVALPNHKTEAIIETIARLESVDNIRELTQLLIVDERERGE